MVEWRPVGIPKYASFYEVSNTGSVRRIGRSKRAEKRRPNAELSAAVDGMGYPIVVLCIDGQPHTIKVHRLVAHTFLDGPGSETVNHKNGIKSDNRVENLEWSSYSQNNSHALNTGLKIYNFPRRIVTNEQVSSIFRLRSEGHAVKKIAESLGLKYGTVYAIAREKNLKRFNGTTTQTNVSS